MVLIDTALNKRHEANNPIKVGMVGAGFMAKGIVLQIHKSIKGMEVVAIANRTLANATKAYNEADITVVNEVQTVMQLEESVGSGQFAVTNDPKLLCEAKGIDVIIEVTGFVEYSAHVAMAAIENKKHIVLMNAELDATVGPMLKVLSDKAGVIYTNVDGDQPGVIMNLFRYVKGIGIKPVLCGNIKGLQDRYRNPTTQAGFAKQWGQTPSMVTSFADGTKISFEQAIVANGTGMGVGKRGMHGPTVEPGTPIRECIDLYPEEDMLNGAGIVDYIVGADPKAGIFVIGTQEDPKQKHYLKYYKLGDGPFYCFYMPDHICHFEVHNTIARAVLFNDAVLAPLGKPYVDVVAAAKIDLKAGQKIDGIGFYMTYGLCENSDITTKENLLPMGLAEDCVLKSDIPKDQVITYDDVILPEGRLIDKIRQQQVAYFST